MHGWGAIRARATEVVQISEPRTVAPIDLQNRVYARSLELLPLREAAVHDLTARGLKDDQIRTAGFKSCPRRGGEARAFIDRMRAEFGDATLARIPGFLDKNRRINFWTASATRDGYLVPYRDELGRITGLQVKILGGKYRTLGGARLHSIYHVAGTPFPGRDVHLTEGGTKAIVANALAGITVFAVPGQTVAEEHIDRLKALRPGRVIVDLDREANDQTEKATHKVCRQLREAGFAVWVGVWEGSDVGGPKGLDDLLLAGGFLRLRRVKYIAPGFGDRRVVSPEPEPGEVVRGLPLVEARERTRARIAEFMAAAKSGSRKALLIKSSPSVGKTTAVAEELRAHGLIGRVLTATTRNAVENAERFGWGLVEGRNERNCERIEDADAVGQAGFDVEQYACGTLSEPRCPVRAACERSGYYAQFSRVGTQVGATEQVFNRRFLRGGSILVFDDADLDRTLVERHRISRQVLAAAHGQLQGRAPREVLAVIDLLAHALVDVSGRLAERRSLVGTDLWDHLAWTAARQRVDLVTTIGSLPGGYRLPGPASEPDRLVTAATVVAVPPRHLQVLIELLTQELPGFLAHEPFNSRLRMDADGYDAWVVREPLPRDASESLISALPVLVTDATPVPALVDILLKDHAREPDLDLQVGVPEQVEVVQYATGTRGMTVFREDTNRLREALAEVVAARHLYPVEHPLEEGIVGFKACREDFIGLAFAGERILHYGAARATNDLQNVRRLHLCGRPMPPGDDLGFLANVLHSADAEPVFDELQLKPERYGGQAYSTLVARYVDPRLDALRKAKQDDEMLQAIHRARPALVAAQGSFGGAERTSLVLVLHTNYPVPGLRVDRLIRAAYRVDHNEEEQRKARERVLRAADEILAEGMEPTANEISRRTGANKQTIAKALGTPVHTLRRDPHKGVNRCPQPDAQRPTKLTVSPSTPVVPVPTAADRTNQQGERRMITPSATELTVTQVPIDDLHPDPANPRKISDAELDALTASLRQWGFVQPVLARSEDQIVIGGHQRLGAARRLGYKTVPVTYLDITLEQARALNLALNKISGEWDQQLLEQLLHDLSTSPEIDLALTGFSAEELSKLMQSLETREKKDRPEAFDLDAALEAATRAPRAQRGDVWLLGGHRIACGDSTSEAEVSRLMAGARAGLAFTDPPYNVDLGHHGGHQRGTRKRSIANDAMSPEAWDTFVRGWSGRLLEHVDGAIYVCMSTKEWPTVSRVLEELGGHWSDTIIWAKDRFVLGRADYQRQYEPIWFGWREGAKHHWCGDRDQGDVWQIDRPGASPLHPTTKPLELAEKAILNSSRAGDVVLDLFLGSGTTLVASERTGRVCYAMEIDPAYVDVAVMRWESFTGEKARREAAR